MVHFILDRAIVASLLGRIVQPYLTIDDQSPSGASGADLLETQAPRPRADPMLETGNVKIWSSAKPSSGTISVPFVYFCKRAANEAFSDYPLLQRNRNHSAGR